MHDSKIRLNPTIVHSLISLQYTFNEKETKRRLIVGLLTPTARTSQCTGRTSAHLQKLLPTPRHVARTSPRGS